MNNNVDRIIKGLAEACKECIFVAYNDPAAKKERPGPHRAAETAQQNRNPCRRRDDGRGPAGQQTGSGQRGTEH